MLTKEQDNALTILTRRAKPRLDSWNTYVVGYWVCHLCGSPFTDHETHGFAHLKKLNISAFA